MIKVLKPLLAVGNAFVRWALRSRFHWTLSHNVVLLEITGRKSGNKYLVPVNYRLSTNGITIMTYRRRQWWRNLRGADTLPVYFKGKKRLTAVELVLDDLEAIASGLVDRGWVRKSVAPARAEETVLIRLNFTDDEEKPVG